MKIENPYDYSHPVLDPRTFGGRRKVLEDITYCLALCHSNPPQNKNIAIIGRRGIGKTSLLNKVQDLAETEHGLIAVRIELDNELAADHRRLFRSILIELHERLSHINIRSGWIHNLLKLSQRVKLELEVTMLVAKLKAKESDSEQEVNETLVKGLREISAKAKTEGFSAVIICIDEANLLSSNQTCLQILRNTFQHLNGYCLYLAGTEELLEQLGNVFGPIQRFFDQIPLGPLANAHEVRDCLRLSLKDHQKKMVSDEYAKQLFELTGGHPFAVKLAAFHSYREMKLRGWSKMRLTVEVEDMALRGIQQLETGAVSSDYSPFLDIEEEGSSEDLYDDTEEISDEDLAVGYRRPIYSDEDVAPVVGQELPLDMDGPRDVNSVVNKLDQMVANAVEKEIDDLLVFQSEGKGFVRYRKNRQWAQPSLLTETGYERLVARVKVVAQMDISERRIPQSGTFLVQAHDLEPRVVSVRTAIASSGETLHFQFARPTKVAPLSDYGFSKQHITSFVEGVKTSKGLWIVSANNFELLTESLAAIAQQISKEFFVVKVGQSNSVVEDESAISYPLNTARGFEAGDMLKALAVQNPDAIVMLPPRYVSDIEMIVNYTNIGQLVIVGYYAESVSDLLSRWKTNQPELGFLNSLQIVVFQDMHTSAVEFISVDQDWRDEVRKRFV